MRRSPPLCRGCRAHGGYGVGRGVLWHPPRNRRSGEVPGLVRAAGERAVAAYVGFFNGSGLAPGTRKGYDVRARRFLSWAERLGRTLNSITKADVEAYIAELAAEKSQHLAVVYLSPVRALFRHFDRSGVIAIDPCPKGQPNGKRSKGASYEPEPGRLFGAQQLTDKEFPEPRIQLSKLKQEVLEIGKEDGWAEDDDDFQAGLVMLAEFSIDTRDPVAVSRFTGVPEPLVREFAGRLIENGVWLPDGKIAADWFDQQHGAFAFMLNVWVTTGELERGKAEEGDAVQVTAGPESPGDRAIGTPEFFDGR
jgi:integrase family protein with SAM-like domain